MKKIIAVYIFLIFIITNISAQCLYKYSIDSSLKTDTYKVPFYLKNANNKNVPFFDSIENEYYSKMYSDLNEAALYDKYNNFESIRLVVMPAFSKSILVNIKKEPNEDSLIVEVKIFTFSGRNILMSEDGIDLLNPDKKVKVEKKAVPKTEYKLSRKKISKKYWTEIVAKLIKVNKVYGCKLKKNTMPDGTLILIEEHFKTGYFIVKKYYDEKKDVDYAMLIKYIFIITGLN